MRSEVDVAIVGGGAAGIGAARRVAATGRTALILEARDRVGGRAWTMEAGGYPLDMGCGWLHSADRNPWVARAQALGIAVDRSPANWMRQFRELGFPEGDQREARAAFAAMTKAMETRPPASDRALDMLDPNGRWTPWLDALSGYINGAALAELSVADYLAYDEAATEQNWRVPDGYGTLVTCEARDLEVALGTAVTAIDLAGSRVRVATARGTVIADAVIVTLPTDVLAGGHVRFDRGLTDTLAAAAALPLGLANKLFLAWAGGGDVPRDAHLIGDPHRAETGSYTLRPFGRPLIEAFFGGTGARELEAEGAEATAAFAIDELAALLGSGIRREVTPLAASAWAADPFARGSYSHARPGHAGARAALARSPDPRLAFAGEATSRHDFSTAHGALESGIRAADEVLATLA